VLGVVKLLNVWNRERMELVSIFDWSVLMIMPTSVRRKGSSVKTIEQDLQQPCEVRLSERFRITP
jgi:hypothetical protein